MAGKTSVGVPTGYHVIEDKYFFTFEKFLVEVDYLHVVYVLP